MKKLVKESLSEFINEALEETQFTSEQQAEIKKFIAEYKGNFKDEDLHTFAEKLGLDKSEVEEYIYNIARESQPEKSNKKGFETNIEQDTLDNDKFRKVLYTAKNMQLVLMTLKPGEDIGEEVHPAIDQFFRIEAGIGKSIINDNEYDITDGDIVIIPQGCKHNIINTGNVALQMYTIYTPPNHQDKIEFTTKEEASKSKEKFNGTTTE
jgi:mannose-6-phosphate isomerase-like protein (cupin superfamily)